MHALVADDDRTTTAILSKALQRLGMKVTVVNDGASAWESLAAGSTPELAIVDWMMPGLDGIELCRRVRRQPTLAGMYLILLTGRDTRRDLIAGLDAGADDYMIKPIDTEELRARVQVGLRVATLQRNLAERVAELQSARDHLARLASTDELTDVYSRRWWFDLARSEFVRARRYGRPFSVFVFDLDFFKQVNDRFGHDTGDKVLQRFADILRRECRQSDLIGRLGGEEFAVLAPETTLVAAQNVAARVTESCRHLDVTTPAGIARCTCSVGITGLLPSDTTIESVLLRTDAALYEAKRSGRDCWKSSAVQP